MKADFYERITNRIVADLETGVRPWLKPWSAQHMEGKIIRPLRANGKPYNGINVINLWAEAVARGFGSPVWMTYRQAQEIGGQVRKGENGSLVVYADRFTRKEEDPKTGEETDRSIPFLKSYTVFNVAQIDGLPARFAMPEAPQPAPETRIESAEAFFAATRADIRHGGDRAYYAPHPDFVQMPPFACFADSLGYYATLAHEVTHWTRHERRLHREFGRKRFGDEGYAMEELVAELGAAFLCADLGLTPEPREDHASYIASWLKVLKNDKRAVFSAAAHAQRAADYLHGLQPASIPASQDPDALAA